VGKTAVSVAIAQRLDQDGYPFRLARLATAEPDEAAHADARCFGFLSLSAEKGDQPLSLDEVAELVKAASSSDAVFIVELPSGFPPSEAGRTLR